METHVTSRSGKEGIVFRNNVTVWIGVIIASFIFLIAVPAMVSSVSGNEIAGAVFSFGLLIIWLFAGWSKIVVTGDGVIVDSFAYEHVIPWSDFNGFVVNQGLNIKLKDGALLPVFFYGKSLLGELAGYRAINKTCARMNEVCEHMSKDMNSETQRGRSALKISWFPLPILLIFFEGISLITHLANR